MPRRRRGAPAGAEGVRPSLGAPRPPRPRPDARPAPRAGVGVHVRRRHADRGRPRAPAETEARRCGPDRHRVGDRLQGRSGARSSRVEAFVLRSLRFRLPALFLLGILLAGVVATLIAARFFQSYTRTHAAPELRAEAAGIV